MFCRSMIPNTGHPLGDKCQTTPHQRKLKVDRVLRLRKKEEFGVNWRQRSGNGEK